MTPPIAPAAQMRRPSAAVGVQRGGNFGNTPTGDRLAQAIGAPNSICITPGQNQVMFVGESTYPGRIFKVTLEGKVLGVIGKSGRNLKEFSGGHQLACPSENEIYVAEILNWRAQKLTLHP